MKTKHLLKNMKLTSLIHSFKVLIFAASGILSLSGCQQDFAFNEVFKTCTPPESSARFGKNIGPVITYPEANTPFNSRMTVRGTCADGFPLEIRGSGVSAPLSATCSNNEFSAEVTFKSGDGAKEVDVAQPTFQGEDVVDRLCFTQDTVPPKVTVNGQGNGAQTVNTTTVRIGGSCESGLDVEISGPQLTQTVITSCNSSSYTASITFTGSDGLKDVVARQIDRAGNSGADDGSYMTDLTAPVISITGPAAMTETLGTFAITGACEMGPRVLLQGALQNNVVSADCINNAYTANIVLAGTDGTKNIIATQTDVAGNIGRANRDFIKDTLAPDVRITAPANNAMTRSALRIDGVCENGYAVQLSGNALTAATSVNCVSGAFTLNVTLPSPDGAKEIIAVQTDRAGNMGRDTKNYIRDGTAPVITIEAPAVNSVWPMAVTLTGRCEAGLPVLISGTGATANANVSCTNGNYSANVTFSAGEGTKNIIATQTDLVGNTTSVNRNFIRDSSAPAIAITAPANNAYVAATATLRGTCETGINVYISGTGVETPLNTACTAGAFSSLIQFSAGEGNKVVVATQTDAAGNAASDTKTYIKDTIAPLVQITAPAANSIYQASLTLQGTCETGLPVVLSGAGIASSTNATCNNSAFSQSINLSSGDGNKVIVATQTDAAGNIGTDTRTFIRDSNPPVISIDLPAANTSAQAGLSISGRCESALPIVLGGAGLQSPNSATCSNSAYSVAILFTAGEGAKVITASQTDNAGNVTTANRTFIRDNTAPIVTIANLTDSTYVSGSTNISGACESGLQVQIGGAGIQSPVDATCANDTYSATIAFSAGDGAKIITASQTDAAGNMGRDTVTVIRDTTAPDVEITDPVANTVARNGLTVIGRCETGLDVSITGAGVQSAITAICNNGNFSQAVVFTSGDGAKVVTATQTDPAGNIGSSSRTFQRDNTGPAIAITAPAAGAHAQTGLTVSGTCEVGLQVLLSGTGLNANLTTSCSAGTFSAAILFSSGDGSKDVIASQTDAVGNSSFDTRNFVRDTIAPIVRITAPAENSYVTAASTLSGDCETGIAVSLAGSGLSAPVSTGCTNSRFSANVAFSAGDGVKVVTASQSDRAGNIGTDTRNFNFDGTAPLVRITAPAANYVVTSSVMLNGTCETGITVFFGGAGHLSPPSTACNNGAFSADVQVTNGDGDKLISASQTDAAGNIGTDSRTFIRDATAPIVTITTPANNARVGATAALQGTCETGLAVNLSGSGLASTGTTSCTNSAFAVTITFTNGDGAKVITVTQTDLAGNIGTDTKNYTRDSTAPGILITAPAANTVAARGLRVSGSCETGLNVTLAGAGVQTVVTTACSAAAFAADIVFTNTDGNKLVTASQTDALGNIGTDSRTFIRDSTPPVLTIDAPAVNTVAQTGLTITGRCETGLPVNISGAGVQANSTATCTASAYSAAILFSNGDGSKVVTVMQTDAAGNLETVTRPFIRDNTAPVVAITAPAENSYVGASARISGTCESGITVNITGAGVQSATTATCSNGAFATAVNFSTGDGNKVVTATQTDAAGNLGTNSRTFIRDGIAPIIAITSPAANSVYRATLTLQGSCETGLTVNIAGAGVQAASTTSCSNGSFSTNITLSNGDGTKVVTASQTDLASNVGSDSRNFIKDATTPVITITGPAAGTNSRTGLTLVGNCEAGLDVLVNGAGVLTPVTTSCSAGTFSTAITFSNGDGSKNIVASQTDLAGNIGSDNRNFVKDTIAPVILITSPAANTSSVGSITVGGTCETGLTVSFSGDVSASSTTNCAGGQFSASVAFSNGFGAKTITASQTDLAGNTGSDSRIFDSSNNNGLETFTSRGPGGKVDILFVDDNSASMDPEQAALGNRFASFANAMTNVDWQAGIITTDCTTGSPFNFCGQLLDMTGRPAGEYVLRPTTPNYLDVFRNTIQRPETRDCLLNNNCPSGREEGLRSSIQAMNLRDTDNSGFFRNDADLAIVMLTDEDEMSSAPATATRPQQVVDAFRGIWGTTKKLSSYGIIIRPGDTACLSTQRNQLGNNAFYGSFPDQLATLTGGISVSICEPDYSITLTEIGENVTRLANSYDLLRTPIAGSVRITYTPAHTSTFSVSGNRVTIDTPAPLGTRVDISYQY